MRINWNDLEWPGTTWNDLECTQNIVDKNEKSTHRYILVEYSGIQLEQVADTKVLESSGKPKLNKHSTDSR